MIFFRPTNPFATRTPFSPSDRSTEIHACEFALILPPSWSLCS